MPAGNDHLTGAVLVLASALAFSSAGVLTKVITADPWQIITWRGFVGGLAITAYVAWQARGGSLRRAFHLGAPGWLIASIGSAGSICFINAFKLTYVANVAIVYATVPFIAAFFERVLNGQRFRLLTLASAVLSLGGVGLMVVDGLGSDGLTGDLLALGMTVCMALYMVLMRRYPETPSVFAGAASSFQLFILGALVGMPFAVSAEDAWLILFFGLIFALAVILLTEGTRRITAAESGLLGTAETPFAMILAWLVLSEVPPAASLTGGLIVIIAVSGHAGWDFTRARGKRLPAGD